MSKSTIKGIAIVVGITGLVGMIIWNQFHQFNPRDAAMMPTVSAEECVEPPLLTHSVARGTHLEYFYYGTWPDEIKQCTERAFQTWNAALTEASISFTPTTTTSKSNINLMLKELPDHTGGAITEMSRLDSGYVRGGGIVISNNPNTASSCLAYYKIGLHEIGHVLGLGHPNGLNESSVMNNMDGFNDLGNAIPLTPTSCDVAQVVEASKTPRYSLQSFTPITE